MKKFLLFFRRFWGVIFVIGTLAYIGLIFADPQQKHIYIVLAVIFGFDAFLLLKKPKKQKVETDTPALPDHVYKEMRASYTPMQAQNDQRIVEDCLKLMKSTDNLDTFFSRYELGMKHALTLQQAKTVGIRTGIKIDYVQKISSLKAEQTEPVLVRSFEKMRAGAEQLKSPKGKKGRFSKYLELLTEHEHEYEFSNQDVFSSIKAEIDKYLSE